MFLALPAFSEPPKPPPPEPSPGTKTVPSQVKIIILSATPENEEDAISAPDQEQIPGEPERQDLQPPVRLKPVPLDKSGPPPR